MLRIFNQKEIPVLRWSSPKPLNFRPKLETLFFLCIGLILFGLGESLLIASNLGASPWLVLSQGISNVTKIGIGESTFLISLVVIFFWLPLKQMPGIGTILNAIIIASVIKLSIPFLPTPNDQWIQLAQTILGVLVIGLGSGIYLIAHLGAGPRDGLMTGLQRVTDFPIAIVRTTLEILVISIGWSLGGTVGIGTVIFALGIGPAVSVGLILVRKYF